MESTLEKIILCFCLLVFFSCKKKLTQSPIESSTSYNLDIELQSGDLVFRNGDGYFSEQFRKYASLEEKFYSHGGIIRMENGSVMVYHSEASELTGNGIVKKDSLQDFLKNISVYGFYRIDCIDEIKEKIISKADFYFQKLTPFDLAFDISNDDKVYCSELVANCINYGFGKEVIVPKIKIGSNFIYGVDNLYLNDGFHMIYKSWNSN